MISRSDRAMHAIHLRTLLCGGNGKLSSRAWAGSHGQCFPVRGLFSGAISQGQSYVVNLNGAGRHGCLIHCEIVVTGPPPIFRPLHQSLLHRIQMHVIQALTEFLFVSHKTVPKLMLPQRPLGTPPRVQSQRHDLFGVIQRPARSATETAAKSVRGSGQASKHNRRAEIPTAAASLQYANEQIVFRFVESPESWAQVDSDKENTVRVA